MKIEKFEDIKAWQEARKLVNDIFRITSQGEFSKKYKFREQISDAAISVMANIAEGFDAQSDAEFKRFLSISRRSASEVQSHLYVALDQKLIAEESFENIYQKAKEAKKLIGGFIRYLDGKG